MVANVSKERIASIFRADEVETEKAKVQDLQSFYLFSDRHININHPENET
jgi:hypothetical protein